VNEIVAKTDNHPWSGKKAFGVWGLLGGAAGAGAAKSIVDVIQPDNPNNLVWALAGGLTVGILLGALSTSGVLHVRFLSPRKTTIQV